MSVSASAGESTVCLPFTVHGPGVLAVLASLLIVVIVGQAVASLLLLLYYLYSIALGTSG